MKRCVWVCQKSVVCSGVTWCHRERECVRLLWIVNKEEKKSSDVQKSTSHHVARTHTHTRKEGKGEKTNHHLIHNAALFCSHWLHRFTHCCCSKCSEEGVTQAFTHGLRSCWLFFFFLFFFLFLKPRPWPRPISGSSPHNAHRRECVPLRPRRVWSACWGSRKSSRRHSNQTCSARSRQSQIYILWRKTEGKKNILGSQTPSTFLYVLTTAAMYSL